MKKLIFGLLTVGLVTFWSGCAQEEILNPIAEGSTVSSSMDGNIEQVPDAILDYIAANYPDVTLLSVETETDEENPAIAFEAYLSDGTDVYFDSSGNFLFDETENDSDDQDVSISDLPQTILDYIAANYPDVTIVEANAEDNGSIEVKLSNDLELYFDASGNFIGIDTDDDSDDDSGSDDSGDDSDDDDSSGSDDSGDDSDDDDSSGSDDSGEGG